MFAFIRGILELKTDNSLVISASGVGYRVYTSVPCIQSAGQPGEELTVYTHLHVREDAMMLYGFLTNDELSMFELLITVSGIGPKVGLAIMSSILPSSFALAVITNDVKSLTKAPGVGAKVAQRIILELKDKLKNQQLCDIDTGFEQTRTAADDSKFQEAVAALMVLGHSCAEANRMVAGVYREEKGLESIIRDAIKGTVGN